MDKFWALFKARNMEFYRDKAALSWAFIFPLLIIVGCALAFSNPDQTVLRLGIVGTADNYQDLSLAQQPYVESTEYQSKPRALEQIQHHQIDLLVEREFDGLRYWVNPESSAGLAARQLLLSLDSNKQLAEEQLTGQAVRYVDWVMPGVLAMNMMFAALFGIGYVIVRYRQNGVLKRFQATPVSALQFIVAQMASRLMIVVVVNSLIFIGCDYFLNLLMLGSYSLLLLIVLAGSLSLLALGLVIASRTASEELAGGLLNTLTWPMMFFSEIWFSLENAPGWMQGFANLMPLTHVVKAARAVMIEGAGLAAIAHHLAALLITTALCLLLAARLFRWQRE
ncbi:ABC transporter permease [Litorivivens sp.]|uniref:ABC transporter permease n=1 Tax=Litorivivens sp. TaxID=2020868 RepID=UPI003567ABAB